MKDKTLWSLMGFSCLGALLLAGPAWATIPTTDYPAWVQNLMALGQRAQDVASTASNYAENVMQTYMMAHNLATAPLQTLSMMNGPSGQAYQAYSNLSYQAGNLANDINGQNMAMAGAYNSFSLSGLSPAAFVNAEENAAYGTNAASQNEVQTVQASALKTNNAIKSVQAAEAAIPSAANNGLQRQVELLNEEMVALRKQNITLNSEIQTLVASDALKNSQRAGNQAAATAATNAGNSSFAGWRTALNKSFGVNAPPGTTSASSGQ